MISFRIRALSLCLLAPLLLCSCALIPVRKFDVEQGNIMTPAMLAKLHTGMSKEQVQNVLGSSIVNQPFNQNPWIYLYTYQVGSKIIKNEKLTLWFEGDELARIEHTPASK